MLKNESFEEGFKRTKANMRMEGYEITKKQENFIKNAVLSGMSKKEFLDMVLKNAK